MSRPPRWMVATFALGLLALGSAAAWFHVAQRQYLKQVASANLLTVAQAKLDQIVAWRADEFHHAANLQGSPLFVRAVERWLTGHQSGVTGDLLAQLRLSLADSENDDVRLVDRAGRVLLATSGRTRGLDAEEAAAIHVAFLDRRPTTSDVYFSRDDSIPHLIVVAPLFAPSGRVAEPIGAVVQVVDPRRSLFPLVESWPSSSPSTEALLVRRDGDSVLVLTGRRFQAGARSHPRVPLSRRDVPAVMAVLGTEGVVRGVDYRGVKVLAALRAVPGTPWFLVVKVDVAEALAVWRTHAALVFAVVLGLVLVAGAAAHAVALRLAKAHYRRLYEAEAALGASEARFRTLVEEAGDGFALLDAEGRYLDVNSACCQQLGYAREDLLRLSVADVDPLFSPQQFAAGFQSLAGKPPVTYESVHRRKDGTTFPVEVTLSIVRIGGVPQALSLARDITERKQALQMLRESEARYRLLFEGITDAVFVHGLSADNMPTEFLAVNDAACERLGYTREELLRLTVRDIDAPESTVDVRPIVERLNRGETALFEQTHVAKDGRRIPVEVHVQSFELHGRVVALSVVRDMTERKRSEEALREEKEHLEIRVRERTAELEQASRVLEAEIAERKAAEETVKRERQRFYDVLETLPVYVVLLSADYRVPFANRFFRERFGESEGRRCYEYLFQRDAPCENCEAYTVLKTAAPHQWGWTGPDGRNYDIFDFPFTDENGAALILEMGIDITERKRADEALQKAHNELEQRVAERTEELRRANEELRTEMAEREEADEALRKSEAKYRSLFENAGVGMFRTRLDGSEVLDANEKLCAILHYAREEILGLPSVNFWASQREREEMVRRIEADGGVTDFECRVLTRQGEVRTCLSSLRLFREAGILEGSVLDITERKQAEAALRALARRLDAVREEEHTGIAREIHDELGQALTALRLDLTWVGRKLPKASTALRRRIAGAVALTDEMITLGQRIVGELRPPILDDLGLVPAVEWYARQLATRSGLRIQLNLGAQELVVPDRLAVTGYRIVQEALTNVARHARATHVTVWLGGQDDTLVIEIRDDGQGIRADAVHSPRSLGIVGMRERAASLGGTVQITSSPGAGTTVRVTFPLERRNEPRAPQ